MNKNRKPFVCANWKLNHLLKPTLGVLGEIKDAAHNLGDSVDIVVAPVATVLHAACDLVRSSNIQIAGQNVFHEPQGAFTGEWSAEHLRELGCEYAIVGHSERRQFFGDTDESVAKKVKACLDSSLSPIACVGESLGERQSGKVQEVLSRQVKAAISLISVEHASRLVIAYEPVWAIGTGLSATSEVAQEAHLFIRHVVEMSLGEEAARAVRIIYGGSVKPNNASELSMQPDIDGALVGGASLEAESFLGILRGFLDNRS